MVPIVVSWPDKRCELMNEVFAPPFELCLFSSACYGTPGFGDGPELDLLLNWLLQGAPRRKVCWAQCMLPGTSSTCIHFGLLPAFQSRSRRSPIPICRRFRGPAQSACQPGLRY